MYRIVIVSLTGRRYDVLMVYKFYSNYLPKHVYTKLDRET